MYTMQAQIPHPTPYGEGLLLLFGCISHISKIDRIFLSLELDYPVHVITVQGGFNVCKTINVMHKRVLCKAIAFLGHIIF